MFAGSREAVIPNERSRRRPEWQKGCAVTFPDGQRWHFYDPAPRRVEHEGATAVFWDFGIGFLDRDVLGSLNHNFYRLLRKATRARNDLQRASANLEIAWFLLARNYTVSQDDFQDLLYAAGEAPALWGAIMGHVVAVIERGAELLKEGATDGR